MFIFSFQLQNTFEETDEGVLVHQGQAIGPKLHIYEVLSCH